MARIHTDMPADIDVPEEDDGYYNYRGINQPAMLCAIAVIFIGLLVFLTAAFLPLGLLIMVIGGVWAMLILWFARPVPDCNRRI